MGPKMATNGKTNDLFHSVNEKYPWLAIDLGFYYASDKSSDIGFVYKVFFYLYLVICNSHNIPLHHVLGHRGVYF